jgi:5-methylcytosine-specific restriction endonuclease McrA
MQTIYKKKAIPLSIRRQIAINNGMSPGDKKTANCAYCDAEGSIYWPVSYHRKGSSWVHIGGLEMDHIYPESLGGKAIISNIQLLCRKCNRRKGSKV